MHVKCSYISSPGYVFTVLVSVFTKLQSEDNPPFTEPSQCYRYHIVGNFVGPKFCEMVYFTLDSFLC